MKEPDFWNALIDGLTPDSKSEADLVWIIPLILFVAFTVVFFLGAK